MRMCTPAHPCNVCSQRCIETHAKTRPRGRSLRRLHASMRIADHVPSSLTKYPGCIAGISRKSQELTAIFLGIRLYCR